FGGSLFGVGVSEDQKQPDRHTLYLSQGGLGLPDRDYYLKASFADKKAKYRDYVARMLAMAGWPDAEKNAVDLVAFETRIADASWSRAESRNRDRTYNPTTLAALDGDAPGFPWSAWLVAARVDDADRIVIRQKTAFPKLARIFAEAPIETLQAWAAFHIT